MHTPLLSIIIPTYNRSSLLYKTVQCLLDQIETDEVEIVVNDNASSDGTFEMMSSLAAINRGLIYNRNANNIGLDGNINVAVRKSRGAYLWLFGDDDLLEPGSIDVILATLKIGNFKSGWINYSEWDSTMNHCRTVARAPDIVNELSVTGSELFRKTHFYFSFMSTHIIERKAWLSVDMNQFDAAMISEAEYIVRSLNVALQGNNFYIGTPIIRQRTSIYNPDYLYSMPIALRWCWIFSNSGLNEQDLKLFFKRYVNDYHLTRNAMMKMQYKPVHAWKELPHLITYFWKYPGFWIVVMPLYLVPPIGIRWARSILRIIKSHRTINNSKEL